MCGNACPARPNATATCSMGVCGFTCNPGFADCDGNPANGCETNLNESPLHCGRCENACPARLNATATCSMGVCDFTCNRGFADCDRDSGCETNTRTSNRNCGGCGNVCPTDRPVCIDGDCSTGCPAGFSLCPLSLGGRKCCTSLDACIDARTDAGICVVLPSG
jgi:hypothetical protein